MSTPISFAPMLAIPAGTTDTLFYAHAFGATEQRRWNNDDGSIHVAELAIEGMLFYLHEENTDKGYASPVKYNMVTCTIGLTVADVDQVINAAVAAGAILRSAARDYEYGYRQGEVVDPHGHRWMIQSLI